MKTKKIAGIILSLVVIINTVMPTSIFADNITSNTYVHSGYAVSYDIMNSWIDGEKISRQQISVTITNTSDTAIENWKLFYNFCGSIENIWNAVIETDDNA